MRQIRHTVCLFLFITILACTTLWLLSGHAWASTKVPLNTLPPGTVIKLGPHTQALPYFEFYGYEWIVLDPGTGYVLMQKNLDSYFGGWTGGYFFHDGLYFQPTHPYASFDPGDQHNIAYKLNNDFLNGSSNGIPAAFSAEDQSAIQTHSWTTADELGGTHGNPSTVNCKVGLISSSEFNYYTNNGTFNGIILPQTWYYTRTPWSGGYTRTWNVQVDKLATPDGYNSTNNAFTRPAMYLNPNTLVTVVPGHGETGQSTVAANPSSITSNGIATATITVQLRDTQGIALSNRTVSLTASSGSSTITPASRTTDNNGIATFTVKNNTGETVTYTATDITGSPNILITQTASVTFLSADPGLSTVTPTSASITAGSSQTITVTLVDAGGSPMPNKQVSLGYSTDNPTIIPACGTTDTNGVATFTVRDNTAETVTFTAKDVTDNITLSQTATVTFIHGPASKLSWKTQPSGSGIAGTALDIQPVLHLEDKYGNRITSDSSSLVTLTASNGAALSESTVTVVSGVAAFSNLKTDKAGILNLTAASGIISSAQSSNITIAPAEVNQLVWHRQPSASGMQGTALSTQPVVYLYDQYGNLKTDDSSTKVQIVASDWGFLSGNLVTAAAGVATFNLVPESAGTFTLTAVAYPGVKSVPSSQLTVSPTAPLLNTLQAGTLVNFAGYTWIVLDPSRGYLLMQNELRTYSGAVSNPLYLPFDTNSSQVVFDWDRPTNIAYYLNNTFYNSLPAACHASITAFQRWGVGPNDGQGSNQEGTSYETSKIGLISYSEYKQYESIINGTSGGVSEPWWTRTPRGSNNVWFISYNFLGNDYAFSSSQTIRPTLYIDPLISLDGSIAGFPVPDLIAFPESGPVIDSGPTTVTAAPNTEGNTLALRVSNSRIVVPSFGDAAPAGDGVTNPYTSGGSLSVANGDYIGIYELDNSGKVVAFSQVRVNSGATGVRLNKMIASISAGGFVQLTAKLLPNNIAAPSATWSSSNRGVATVSSTGMVKGVAEGTAVITVSSIDNLSATCQVTVNTAPTIPVTVSTNWPEVTVTNNPVLVNVPAGVNNASLSTEPAVSGGNATVILPQVMTTASTAYGNVSLNIPNQTQVAGPSTWDGKINLPRVVDRPEIVPYGSKAIEIGAGSDTLILSQPVRILLVGQAQNKNIGVGWVKNNVFTYIPYIGSSAEFDTPAAAVGVPGDGYLNLGNDLVIWTKHFTTFVTNVPMNTTDSDGEGSSFSSSTITGSLTDEATGSVINGAKVTLHYADTERNKAAGRTPDMIVPLPGINGFKPDNNKNPQVSDTSGDYGFMVFSNWDYYIEAIKDGYITYRSAVISMGQDTVNRSFKMHPEGSLRLYGQNRVDTALAIAKAAFSNRISCVVLATSQNYPDALAGSVLAAKFNSPILLVGTSTEEQDKVITYLKGNLDPAGTVYILGGSGAVSTDIESKIKDNGFNNINRLNGADRYKTAAKIVESEGIETGTPVVLVSGENYPDALSVSSAAVLNQYPILLVSRDGIPEEVKKEIAKINPSKVYIIGLQGSVSTEVENQLTQVLTINKANVIRIGGTDRYETSLQVAKYFNLPGVIACIATGNNFPDALAGSVYAGLNKAPVLLVNDILTNEQIEYLKSRQQGGITIFGGEEAVSRDIETQLIQVFDHK